MGLRNPRAVCPACGGKIHTQPRGLGHLAQLGRSPIMLQTGKHCQHCGVALTGKIGVDNRAKLVDPEPETANCAARTRIDGVEVEMVDGHWQPIAPTEETDDQQSAAELLVEIGELHSAGVLTDEEFRAKKRELLDRL